MPVGSLHRPIAYGDRQKKEEKASTLFLGIYIIWVYCRYCNTRTYVTFYDCQVQSKDNHHIWWVIKWLDSNLLSHLYNVY